MKKFYLRRTCLLAIVSFMTSFSMAQCPWKVNAAKSVTPAPVPLEEKVENGLIYLGYARPDDVIYPYDGLSLDFDAKVGVAIKLPRAKFAPYIGGKLSQLYLGWDTEEMNGQAEAFVRTSLDGENLAAGKGTLKFGWNTLQLDAPVNIPDVDTLVLGFYTQLKKGVIAIPKVYPQNQPHSCYLWTEGDLVNGKENWLDANEFGTMTILGVVEDTDGRFNNMMELESARFDHVVYRDSVATTLVRLKNVGSNAITSMEVTSDFNGKKWSMSLPFDKGIAPSTGGKVYLPYCGLGSGTNKFYISKINGVEVKNPEVQEVNLVTIPYEVAQQYTLHHLLEFWTSENSYMHVAYFEEYTRPYLQKFSDRVTLVNQHTDDQFMTGEDDDVAHMMLDFVNNDSMRVYIPSISLNRNRYVLNRAAEEDHPLSPVFYPEYGEMIMNEILDYPTFASVQVDARMNDGQDKAQIKVSGNVAEGVLPAGEPLYLTVYLMEYDVESDSQIFWDENQKDYYNGIYKHYNVIRQVVTPVYGKQLAQQAGDYTQSFEVDLDETWNAKNLRVVAFLNRGIANASLERQVINSCEANLSLPTGVGELETAVSAPVEIYNLTGVRMNGFNGKGVYLVKTVQHGKTVVRKVFVK